MANVISTQNLNSSGVASSQPKPAAPKQTTLQKMVDDVSDNLMFNLMLLPNLAKNAVSNVGEWGRTAADVAGAVTSGAAANWIGDAFQNPMQAAGQVGGFLGAGLNAMGAGFGSDVDVDPRRFAQWAYEHPLDAALIVKGALGSGAGGGAAGMIDNLDDGAWAGEYGYPDAVGNWQSAARSLDDEMYSARSANGGVMPEDPYMYGDVPSGGMLPATTYPGGRSGFGQRLDPVTGAENPFYPYQSAEQAIRGIEEMYGNGSDMYYNMPTEMIGLYERAVDALSAPSLSGLVDQTGQGMMFDPAMFSKYRDYHYGA